MGRGGLSRTGVATVLFAVISLTAHAAPVLASGRTTTGRDGSPAGNSRIDERAEVEHRARPQAPPVRCTAEEVRTDSGPPSLYRNRDCSYTATFSVEGLTDSAPPREEDVTFEQIGDRFLSQGSNVLVGVTSSEVTVEDSSGQGIAWALAGTPQVSGNFIRYQSAGLTWQYEVRQDGVKLSSTLELPRGLQTYEFPYSLKGDAHLLPGGDGQLVSERFIVPRAFALGANGRTYKAGAWRMLSDDRVAFDFDDSGLPPKAFPYELDPTTTFDASYDGYVGKTGATYPPLGTGTKGTTTVDTSTTTISAMRTKRDPCLPELTCPEYEIRNGLVRWNTSSLPDNALVTGATARLRVSFISDSDSRSLTADWADLASIGADDYSETAQSTAMAGVALSAISYGQQDFSLSGAPASVSKTGSTGLRFHIGGSQPSGENELTFRSMEHSTGPAPALLVSYSTPPSISAVSDTPDPVTADDLLRFDVAWSDADPGDQVRAVICKTNQIDANWTCPGGAWVYGPLSTTSPSSTAFRPTASDHGTKTYYAFACDQANACSTSVTGSFTVQNRTPTISSVIDSPDPVTAGTAITFSMSWSDAGDSVRAVICKTDALTGGACPGGAWATGSLRSTSPSTATYSPTAANAGSNNYYAFACDPAGACSGSTAGTFTVKNPAITSASDSPDPVSSGDPITFSVGWSDSDAGDSVKAVVCKTNQVSAGSCPGGSWATGALSATSPSTASFTPTAANQGTKTYYAFACDQAGACSTSVSGTFTVDNRTPTIGTVTDSPDPVTEGDALSFTASWTDPGDTVKALICKTDEVSGGSCPGGTWATGALSATSPVNASFTPGTADRGAQNYFAFVCDAASACSSSVNGTFTVQRRAPAALSVADSPDPASPGQVVRFTLQWTHDEPVKALICKTNSVSAGSCSGGAWATGQLTEVSPSMASYETVLSDFGTKTYYAFACDSTGLCSSSRSGTFTIQTDPPPEDPTLGQELIEQRSKYETAYRMADGTKIAVVYTEPIHYLDAGGDWQRIDSRIVTTGDVQYPWKVAATQADIRFPAAIGAGTAGGFGDNSESLVAVSLSGRAVGMAPQGASHSVGTVDGSTITYPQVYPGVDWALTAQGDELKESLILHAPPLPGQTPTFDFSLDLDGLQLQPGPSGEIDLVDGSGAVVLTIPPAWMEEAAPPSPPGLPGGEPQPQGEPAHSHAVQMQIVVEEGETVLRLVPDAAWLSDPARRYPVVIDPTLDEEKAIKDTFMTQGDTGNHSGDPRIRVGKNQNDNDRKNRGLVKFDGIGYNGATVTRALVWLHQMDAAKCESHTTALFRITAGWDDTYVHWDSHPDHSPPEGAQLASTSTGCQTSTWFSFEDANALLPVVRGWADGSVENHGFYVKSLSEDLRNGFRKFSSREDPIGGPGVFAGPKMWVWYNFRPRLPDSFSPASGTVSGSTQPTLRADFEDPDPADEYGHIEFEIYRASNMSFVTWGVGNTVPNHSSSSWTVPAGALSSGVEYLWRARGVDTAGAYGDWPSSYMSYTPWYPPTLNSVTDSPDPVYPGQQILFTANWSDPDPGDPVRAVICKSPGISGGNCSGGTWAAGSAGAVSPSTASYTPVVADVGTRSYSAYVCDSRNYCSARRDGSFTVREPTPLVLSAQDSPDPVVVGDPLTFSVGWFSPTSGERVRAVLCRTNAIAEGLCPGTDWVTGNLTSTSPARVTAWPEPQDGGAHPYYAFVCNAENVCSPNSIAGSFTVSGPDPQIFGQTCLGDDGLTPDALVCPVSPIDLPNGLPEAPVAFIEEDVAASPFPPYDASTGAPKPTVSRYIRIAAQTDPQHTDDRFHELGCFLGQKVQNGDAPKDALVVLAFGAMLDDGVKNGVRHYAVTLNSIYVADAPLKKVRFMTLSYVQGWLDCVGTPNQDGESLKVVMGTNSSRLQSYEAGQAWAKEVVRTYGDLPPHVPGVIKIWGGNDIEPGFPTDADRVVEWVEGYVDRVDGTDFRMINYGGTDCSAPTTSGCEDPAHGWNMEKLYQVSWGIGQGRDATAPGSLVMPLPQIYNVDPSTPGVASDQDSWYFLAQWAFDTQRAGGEPIRIRFLGALTQKGACIDNQKDKVSGNECKSTEKALPSEAWKKLQDRLAQGDGTEQAPMAHSTDIRWQN